MAADEELDSWEKSRRTDRHMFKLVSQRLRVPVNFVMQSNDNDNDDAQRNSDMVAFTAGPWRIATRVRKWADFRFGSLTFRTRTASGGRDTEWFKMLQGFGDYFVYAWANDTWDDLKQWVIVDLGRFRKHVQSQDGKDWLAAEIVNTDGSAFLPVKLKELPVDVVIDKSPGVRLAGSAAEDGQLSLGV